MAQQEYEDYKFPDEPKAQQPEAEEEFELVVEDDDNVFRLSVVDEKHYQLTNKDGISDLEITSYCQQE
jgi:hypothetical protein